VHQQRSFERSRRPPQAVPRCAKEATTYQRGKASEVEAKAFETLKRMDSPSTPSIMQLQKQVEKLWGEFSAQYPAVQPRSPNQ
jgi:hypothetical protein